MSFTKSRNEAIFDLWNKVEPFWS